MHGQYSRFTFCIPARLHADACPDPGPAVNGPSGHERHGAIAAQPGHPNLVSNDLHSFQRHGEKPYSFLWHTIPPVLFRNINRPAGFGIQTLQNGFYRASAGDHTVWQTIVGCGRILLADSTRKRNLSVRFGAYRLQAVSFSSPLPPQAGPGSSPLFPTRHSMTIIRKETR